MLNTSLENKYQVYWIEKPKEWHSNTIGIYHVSSVGCNHQDLNPDEHSGPCIRQTFYEYINPIDDNDQTKGNFHVGTIDHKEVIRIYRSNNPNAVDEFPIYLKLVNKDGIEIIIKGSIDLLVFVYEEMITYDILDFKTASDYTFPHHEGDKNPTHFDQVRVYTSLVENYIFGKIKARDNILVYINKHNLYTGEQREKYDSNIGLDKLMDFVSRCFELHGYLIRIELPPREPMKWCKYCKYGLRCKSSVIRDEDVEEFTEEEIQKFYEEETGKSPIWRGNYTKAYESFRSKFKVSDQN